MSAQMGQYYVRMGTQLLGPLSWDQLKSLKDRGRLQPFHSISADGRTWQPASSLTELFPVQSPTISEASPQGGSASPAAATMPASNVWYYLDPSGQQQGPVTESQLLQLLEGGSVTRATLVWKPGMEQWQPLSVAMRLPAEGQAQGLARPRGRVKKHLQHSLTVLAIVMIVESALALVSIIVVAIALDQVLAMLGFQLRNQFAIPPAAHAETDWLQAVLAVLGIAFALCEVLAGASMIWSAYQCQSKSLFAAAVASGIVILLGLILTVALRVVNMILPSIVGTVLEFIGSLTMGAGWFVGLLFLRLVSLEEEARGLATDFGYQMLMFALAKVAIIAGPIIAVGALGGLGLAVLIIGLLGWLAVNVWTIVDLYRLRSHLRG